MTQSFFPFDAGVGSSVTEAQWRKMARLWLRDGVVYGELNQLAVSQRAAGANMSVDVATGRGWLTGHFYESDAVVNLPIAANLSGNARIDRIVVHADFVANTIGLAVLQGTPAASPTEPALTQSVTVWEIALARVAVAAAAASILNANITDERVTTAPPSARVYNNANISCSNGVNVVVTFNSERWDNAGLHSTSANTSRLTAPVAGKYLIFAHIAWANTDTTGYRRLGLQHNGATKIAGHILNGDVDDSRMSVSTVWDLAVGDYVEVLVFQGSAGALSIDALSRPGQGCDFGMQWVGS